MAAYIKNPTALVKQIHTVQHLSLIHISYRLPVPHSKELLRLPGDNPGGGVTHTSYLVTEYIYLRLYGCSGPVSYTHLTKCF